jgi:hypothetical protein
MLFLPSWSSSRSGVPLKNSFMDPDLGLDGSREIYGWIDPDPKYLFQIRIFGGI